MKLVQPFLIGMGETTQEEADRLYHQAEMEMLSEDFCALWRQHLHEGSNARQCHMFLDVAVSLGNCLVFLKASSLVPLPKSIGTM